MKRIWQLGLVIAALAIFHADGRAEAPFKVIVNRENPIASTTKSELSRLFLKKASSWSDGSRVSPVDLVEHSHLRAAFSSGILGRPVRAVKAYWQQRVFSGADVPPPEFPTESDIVEYVESHAGAIGYVSAETSIGRAKAIEVVTDDSGNLGKRR